MREDVRTDHEVSIVAKCDRCGAELDTNSVYEGMTDEITVGVDVSHECDTDDHSLTQ